MTRIGEPGYLQNGNRTIEIMSKSIVDFRANRPWFIKFMKQYKGQIWYEERKRMGFEFRTIKNALLFIKKINKHFKLTGSKRSRHK